MQSIDDIKKSLRAIEITYDYNHSVEDYDILVNLSTAANTVNDIRSQALEEFAGRMISMMPGHRQDILAIAENLKINTADRERQAEEVER